MQWLVRDTDSVSDHVPPDRKEHVGLGALDEARLELVAKPDAPFDDFGLDIEADLVLMDEREGRRAAQRLGLKTLGVVGVLLDAKRQGFLRTVRPAFDALRTVGFYLGEPVYRRGLELAGELEGA